MIPADAPPDGLAYAATATVFGSLNLRRTTQFEAVPVAGHEHHRHTRTLRRRRSNAGHRAVMQDFTTATEPRGGDDDAV